MEKFESITKILGLDNLEEIKAGMKDIILKKFEEDLNDYDLLLFVPDAIEEIIVDVCEEVKEEVKDKIKLKRRLKNMNDDKLKIVINQIKKKIVSYKEQDLYYETLVRIEELEWVLQILNKIIKI
ncbi:MAG: hypothetical protein WAP91_00325 [Bacilli bacterium]